MWSARSSNQWSGSDPEPPLVAAAAVGVRTGLNLVALFGIIAQPLIPQTAKTILDTLGVPPENRTWPEPDDTGLLNALPHGMPISAPPVLFQKIEDDMIAAWSDKFGGAESSDTAVRPEV